MRGLLAGAFLAAAIQPPMVWPIQQAEKALVDLVGEDLFREHLVFLPDASMLAPGSPECETCSDLHRRPHFLLIWSFRVKGKPFVDEQVLVAAGEDGSVPLGVEGLPNCRVAPALCDFPVDEAEALRIAREERFERGLEPWKATFHFNAAWKRFVWSVSNLLIRREDGGESGEELQIDASTGVILSRGRWFAS